MFSFLHYRIILTHLLKIVTTVTIASLNDIQEYQENEIF